MNDSATVYMAVSASSEFTTWEAAAVLLKCRVGYNLGVTGCIAIFSTSSGAVGVIVGRINFPSSLHSTRNIKYHKPTVLENHLYFK